jgi:dolichol-phosphate mannosyltransferase
MTERPRYSIVAPVYNEEGNIQDLYNRISTVMDSTDEAWELILVNDGSRDRSLELMVELAAQDRRVKVVNFARNFGHQTAVTAGIDFSSGNAVILIDADLQDPPEVILDLIERWKAGYEVVYAVREERKGESKFKIWTAKLFYRAVYRITDVKIPLDTGDFRLMDEKVVNVLKAMREHNRFIRGLTSWVGFKQIGVNYVREARHWGRTKYPLRKMVRFAIDGITSFSYFPLQIMIYVSLVLAVLTVLAVPIIAVLRVAVGYQFLGGQVTMIVLLLMLTSFQLFFMFIMGQYVARIYDEVRGRPLYIVASTAGFADDSPRSGSGDSPKSYVPIPVGGVDKQE